MKDKIVPSAPFKNYNEIESLANKVSGKLHRIQVDICDGEYVPSVSWPFTEWAKHDFEELKNKKDLDVFLPHWEEINYSADLMCLHPEKYIETLVAYGFDEIIVHFRSLDETNFLRILELVEKFNLNLFLAVDVKTDLNVFMDFLGKNNFEYLHKLNGVQAMGIEKIGFQGQVLDPKSLEIVATIKSKFPEIIISFDGAINDASADSIKRAGADVFCVGSYLTKTRFFSEDLQVLKDILREDLV